MKSKKAFKEEVSPGLSIENSKCSTVELQEEVCSEKTEHTEWADLEGWNSMTYSRKKVSCSLWLKRMGLVVGKRGDCTMKDETQEMDRDHKMQSLNFILWDKTIKATVDSEIIERYDKIWILERLFRWWCENGIWNKWSGGRKSIRRLSLSSEGLWGSGSRW